MILWIFLSHWLLWTSTDSTTYFSVGQKMLPLLDHSERPTVSTPATTTLQPRHITEDLPEHFSVQPHTWVNITGQLGVPVHLHCSVSDLTGETTVSWLRREEGELRLLAVGLELYSRDSRYSVRLLESSDWLLTIAPVLENDEGSYECQVPSHPPRVHTVYLHVIVPELDITDERDVSIRDKFYNSGSTIQLKCRLTRVPRPSHFLLWRHNRDILNYDISRGGISVRTDLTEDGAWSRLLMVQARTQDSGNYSCSLADVASTTVTVHVLNGGETPAAMQHGGSRSPMAAPWWILLLAVNLGCHSFPFR